VLLLVRLISQKWAFGFLSIVFLQARFLSHCSVNSIKATQQQLFCGHYTGQCVSWHSQLRTGGFCCGRVLLPVCPCWWQLVHLDWGEDARVLLGGITCIVSIPVVSKLLRKIVRLMEGSVSLLLYQWHSKPDVSGHSIFLQKLSRCKSVWSV